MADDMQGQLKTWQQLKQQAIDGQFRMEEGIGEALRKRCETFLQALKDLKRDAAQLDHLSGYGSLPSAKAMQQKYEQKAANGGTHDPNDSAVTRLQQNIEVVQLMQDTYAAAIGKLEESDQNSGSRLNDKTEEVN